MHACVFNRPYYVKFWHATLRTATCGCAQVAAALAVRESQAVQKIGIKELQALLAKRGQILRVNNK